MEKHKAAEKNELWKCFGLRWLGTSPISLVVVGLADHFGSFHTIYHMQCSIRSGPTRESNSALDARSQRHYGWQMVPLLVIVSGSWLFVYITHKPAFVGRYPPWVAVVLETGGEFRVRQVCLVLRGFRSMGLHQTDWEKSRSCFFRHTRGIWGLL